MADETDAMASSTPEPGTDEVTAEQPVDEQSVAEQPVAEQPVAEQPVDEQPVDEQPVDEQPVDEQPVDEQPVAEQPVDEPEPRRRSRWTLPVAVVGITLLVCGAAVGGVVYGRASAPGPDIVVTAEPVVEESAAVEPMPVGTMPELRLPQAPGATGSETPSGDPAPAILTAAPGLTDTPAVANGYRLVNAGISGAQVAGVLAPALGVAGTPVAEDGAWVVGTTGGPVLRVVDDPLFSWTFEDAGALAAPAFGEQLEPATAIELASALLGSIGVDVASVDWQVDRYSARTAVTAWQVVGGQRTELGWQVGFDPNGEVVQASGFSAGLEEVPGYPVIGAASAIARAATLPWSLIGASPARAPEEAASPSASPLTPLTRPGISVPVTEVTVTAATLGLAQYWQPDGGMLMLPSYTLTGDDGSRWSLLAVDEPYVQFVDQPYPTAAPTAG